ncbi:MAG: HsdM family class I SAM-dependent methyltransferase [Bellilinea sp.]
MLPSLFFSDQPEKTYAARLPWSQRKQLGQVFTPYEIAKFMAQWVTGRQFPAAVLDPALGLGVFLRALLEGNPDQIPSLVGYEIDEQTTETARELFINNGYAQVELRQANFLSASWQEQFDGILCNPPYRKFRGLPDKDSLVEAVKQHTGIALSRAANLYIFFLIKAIWQLAPGGRAAFILPYEFLNADYGTPIKQMMLDQGILRKVILLGDGFQPFEDGITTSCILCLERTPATCPPEWIRVSALEELAVLAAGFPVNERSPRPISATTLPLPSANTKWHVTSIPHTPDHLDGLVPLSTFGRVMRGIATGDNRFFLLTEAERQQYGLDLDCVLPCLQKSNYAPGHMFTSSHFEELRQSNRPVWLLNACGNENHPGVRAYLDWGVAGGSDRRYLTRNRSPWYALEARPPAPLLVTTFSRAGVRWVRNEAAVSNLTAFHGFYPHPGVDLDLLCAYLVTPLAQRILAQNRREYGNGLHKFEPNDLNHALVMDITRAPEAIRNQGLDLYSSFVRASQDENNSSNLIKQLNELFSHFLESSFEDNKAGHSRMGVDQYGDAS